MKTIAIAILAVLAATAGQASAPAPTMDIATTKQIPVTIEKPYDVGADADAAVKAAFARARKSHKRVLIDLGGNWCGDCIVLANLMAMPPLKTFVAAHYEVAMVDVGRFDKNLQIPARFGITKKLEGVPSVLIATPRGRLVNRGHTAALADARHMTPQGIADWLAQWTS